MRIFNLIFITICIAISIVACNSDNSGSVGSTTGGGGSNNSDNLTVLKSEVSKKTASLMKELSDNLTQNESDIISEIEENLESNVIKKVSFDNNSIDNITEYTPDSKAELYNMYGVIFGANYYDQLALYLFLKALKEDSNNSLYMSEVVAYLTALNKLTDAKPFADLASALGVSEAKANISLATYYELSGDNTKAQSLYESAINIDPKSPLIRQFYFQALDRYKSLSEDLLKIRNDSIQYCEDTLTQLKNVNIKSKPEVDNFISAKAIDSATITKDLLLYMKDYNEEHLNSAQTIYSSTVGEDLNNWQSEAKDISDKFENAITYEEDYANNTCISDTSDVCPCYVSSYNSLYNFINEELSSDIISTLNSYIPKVSKGLNQYETTMLNYIMKNVNKDDVESLVKLIKYTYANYKLSCINFSLNYLETQLPYYGIGILKNSIGAMDCPSKEPPEQPEKIKKKMEEEVIESTEEGSDDILNSLEFHLCIPTPFVSLCADYSDGDLGISMESGSVKIEGKRNLIHNVGKGLSISLSGSKDFKIANMSMTTTMNFNSSGDFKNIKSDVQLDTVGDDIENTYAWIHYLKDGE